MLRTARALAASVALGATLLIIPAASPSPAIGFGPLPDCRIDDILTLPRGYDDWSHTLVDWTLSVGKAYKPPDLVAVGHAGLPGGGLIREVAIDDLRALANAAQAHGTPLGSWSAYRSARTQTRLFNDGVKTWGYETAIRAWGRPGHSEHQLGLAIDFSVAGGSGFISGDSATGRWMAGNAWKYGWILSYPNGKQDITCYHYEPWHFRYYGRDLAAKIHDSGLTTREYLWSHYTAVDPKTGEPVSTAPAPSGSSAGSLPPEVTPPALASPAPEPTTSPPAAEASGVPTLPPASPAARWFGLDPPVVLVLFALVLVLVGVAAARARTRRPSTRR